MPLSPKDQKILDDLDFALGYVEHTEAPLFFPPTETVIPARPPVLDDGDGGFPPLPPEPPRPRPVDRAPRPAAPRRAEYPRWMLLLLAAVALYTAQDCSSKGEPYGIPLIVALASAAFYAFGGRS